MSVVHVYLDGMQDVVSRLQRLESPVLRRRVLQTAGRYLVAANKSRVDTQIGIDGKAFGPYSTNTHHKRPRRRKMLARLIRRLDLLNLSDSSVTVGWKNPVNTDIGVKHQQGFKMVMSAKENASSLDGSRSYVESYKDPATRRQALALIDAGFKHRQKGKGYTTPTVRWITQNMNKGQAGFLLSLLRGAKQHWVIDLPARRFFGATSQELQLLVSVITRSLDEVTG